jgi:cation diffusion facilitator CzcD-associated flavoprotein CzcO
MPQVSRDTLAIVGAGPVGLEAAFAALDRGLDVHVFEQGDVATHPVAWGHVRMFTPWRMNVGPATRAHLEQSGWTSPPAESCPTGLELAEGCLQRAAVLPEIRGRIHAHAQVLHIGRRGTLKGDAIGSPERREHPFRVMVRDPGGRESLLHAHTVIDASGTYGQPNWAGDGGIPARGELYLAPQMSYHVDDVLGLRRERYAGKRTLVIGGGLSAATVVSDLVKLATDVPGTTVAWATRETADALYLPFPDDPLPARSALMTEARGFLGSHPLVRHVGGVYVEDFEFNSATHRYRVTLRQGEQPLIEEVDHVIVNTGYGPANSLYRELQVHECYASFGSMKLSAALLETPAGGDCLKAVVEGVEALTHPEPGFFVLGAKSYGRNTAFLLDTGYRQVADVMERIAKELGAALAR